MRSSVTGILSSPASGGAKENSGESAKRRTRRKFASYALGGLSTYVVLSMIYQAHFAGMFVPNVDIDPNTGRARIRRRPNRQHKLFGKSDTEMTSNIDAILEGYLTLVGLSIPPNALQGDIGDMNYKGIEATFCSIDWKLQKDNPSTVAMFRDLQTQSKMCDATMTTVDLADILQQVTDFDTKLQLDSNNPKAKVYIKKQPDGVVFHETRCGSTLAANLMGSIQSTEHHSRVFSESPPPVTALKACDVYACNPDIHAKLIQDVVYLMGRSAKRMDYLFFKIQSIGAMNIDKFTAAFPNVPWVFVYRDSVEIMQSHLGKHGDGGLLSVVGGGGGGGGQTPVCARNYRASKQPATTSLLLQQHNVQEPSELSIAQYCAAHLAGLSLSAIQEHARTGKGRFVNYNTLPDIMWTDVIPNDFHIKLNDDDIEKMKSVSGVYSKGRGQKANKEWKDDTAKKQDTASQSVIDATHMFLDDIYQQMEDLSSSKH